MSSFHRSVFVNCPFDTDYLLLFQSIIFTIEYLGFEARTSYEVSDAGEPRIQKLVRLIRESKFGIHDLSRCQASKAGEMSRMNMPLELGIDYGCKQYRGGKWRTKRILILDARRYRLQKAVSDLAGSDFVAHQNKQRETIRAVSHWLVQEANAEPSSVSEIKANYEDFVADDFERLTKKGYSKNDIKKLPAEELRKAMRVWIRSNKAKRQP